MPVSISAEIILLALIAAGLVVVVLVLEAVVALRALRRAEPRPPRLAVVAIAISGLLLGLALSAFEWIDHSVRSSGALITGVVVIAAIVLTVALGIKPASSWRLAAVLGAAFLFQIAWVGGRHVLPIMPIVGPALSDARCQRDPYCRHTEIVRPRGTANQPALRPRAGLR